MILYFAFFFVQQKIFKGGNAWTARSSDFEQQLIVDLGTVHNITSIDVQGRPFSGEHVTEFSISYGYNGLDYADYKEPGGNIKVKKVKKFKMKSKLIKINNTGVLEGSNGFLFEWNGGVIPVIKPCS